MVDAEPPRLFSFRWVYRRGRSPAPGNSLLVTFELVPSGAGTLLRMTETGFRERGWEVAVLEEQYHEHARAGTPSCPASAAYAAGLVSAP